MSSRWPSALHLAASIAMIGAAVYLVLTAYEVRSRRRSIVAVRPYEVGEELGAIDAIRPLAKEPMLLMWIQSTCPFCTASMPFYRQISGDPGRKVQLVAMGPEPAQTILEYLARNNVVVSQVLTTPQDVRLYSTPTLLLLEPGLKVRSVWTGQLKPADEVAVASAIRGQVLRSGDWRQPLVGTGSFAFTAGNLMGRQERPTQHWAPAQRKLNRLKRCDFYLNSGRVQSRG